MSGSAARPFRVLGVQQVAIGGRSKASLGTLWVDMLGLERTGSFRSERENVDEDICAIGHGAMKVEVDLMEPIDPEGKPAVHATPARLSAAASQPSAAITSDGACTSSISTPSPPIGNSSLLLGWMKQMS